MQNYVYVVYTSPTPGQEAEYHRWYNDQHLADVLKIPGFVAAQRFEVHQPDANAPKKFLALYEVATGDPEATLAALLEAAGTAEMVISDAMDVQSVSAMLYKPITGRVVQAAS
jgi:hypothetical protein